MMLFLESFKTKFKHILARPAPQPRGSFVADVEWHRVEELRPDRLGPGWKDVQDPERPVRTLGPF